MDNKDEFLESISLGMDIASAAQLIGSAPTAMYRLLERGKREDDRLSNGTKATKPKASEAHALTLWREVCQARAQGQRSYIQTIKNAGAEDWKAAKFMLEAMNPGVFSSMGSVPEVEAVPLGEIEAY